VQGTYCVGCCWALMGVLIVAGSMSLGLPAGQLLGRLGGIGLIVAGIVVAL
jgi:predicted metal-binding membrane protein